MNAYYRLTERLKEIALDDIDCNSVSKGDITKLNFDKAVIFPVAHFDVFEVAIASYGNYRFSVRLYAMNQRVNKQDPGSDDFIGNDNEDDNLNAMLYMATRIIKVLENDDEFSLFTASNLTVFTEQYQHLVDGWSTVLQIDVPIGDYTAC